MAMSTKSASALVGRMPAPEAERVELERKLAELTEAAERQKREAAEKELDELRRQLPALEAESRQEIQSLRKQADELAREIENSPAAKLARVQAETRRHQLIGGSKALSRARGRIEQLEQQLHGRQPEPRYVPEAILRSAV